jgi:hypothetical protein
MNPSTPSPPNRLSLQLVLYQPLMAQNIEQRRSRSSSWSVPHPSPNHLSHRSSLPPQHSAPCSLKRSHTRRLRFLEAAPRSCSRTSSMRAPNCRRRGAMSRLRWSTRQRILSQACMRADLRRGSVRSTLPRISTARSHACAGYVCSR